jgi:hypothetical protein
MTVSNEQILETFKHGEVVEIDGQIIDSRFVKTVYEGNVTRKVVVYENK